MAGMVPYTLYLRFSKWLLLRYFSYCEVDVSPILNFCKLRTVAVKVCIDLGFYISRHPPCVVWTPVGPPGLPCVAVPSAPGASPG